MLERKKRILLIDDDRGIHAAMKYLLRDRFDCASAYDGDEARILVQKSRFDLALLDIHMRRHEEGLEILPALKSIDPDLDVVMVSSNTEVDLAGRAAKLGASAYLIKEHTSDQLFMTIESVLARRELLRENHHHVSERQRRLERKQIIGNSPAVKRLMKDIEKVRRSTANIVIVGETGSGKELVARHIGAVDGRPFVAVDSATITSTMSESILFGHEKGAFTGATSQVKGLFEEANGGTIYFDEIANMPLEIQSKLLRVIQEREVKRLGSSRLIPLEFRVICATNRDLETMSQESSFKYDLFQRLNVITLRIPPLRERREDIPLLVRHFMEHSRSEGSPAAISDEAVAALMEYSWPGNVRELSNLMANLCTMVTEKTCIELTDLPEKVRFSGRRPASADIAGAAFTPAPSGPESDFYTQMREMEGKILGELYRRHGGNILQMSRSLKMSRSHLYSKLHAHGIHH